MPIQSGFTQKKNYHASSTEPPPSRLPDANCSPVALPNFPVLQKGVPLPARKDDDDADDLPSSPEPTGY
jgi:hypothetical protein